MHWLRKARSAPHLPTAYGGRHCAGSASSPHRLWGGAIAQEGFRHMELHEDVGALSLSELGITTEDLTELVQGSVVQTSLPA